MVGSRLAHEHDPLGTDATDWTSAEDSVHAVSYQAYNMPPPLPVDPTNVTGKRVGAWFIDAVIYLVLSNVLGALFGLSPKVDSRDFSGDALAAQHYCESWRVTHSGICSHSNGTVTSVTGYQSAIWLFLGLAIVFIVVQGLLGGSLGKLAVGLRIVKADGSLAGVGASAIRTVLWIVDAITCAMPVVGGILIMTTKGHRRVGDMAAGTYVVPQAYVGYPVIYPGQPGWGGYGSGPYQQPGHPGGYGGPPAGGFGAPPGGFGAPGSPLGGPSTHAGGPAPWAPPPGSPGAPTSIPAAPPSPLGGDYEADVPMWDDARNAYIQYDSERSEWLEFDDRSKEWKPISR